MTTAKTPGSRAEGRDAEDRPGRRAAVRTAPAKAGKQTAKPKKPAARKAPAGKAAAVRAPAKAPAEPVKKAPAKKAPPKKAPARKPAAKRPPAKKPAARPKPAGRTSRAAAPARTLRHPAAPRAPFVLLIVGLLGGALISLLFLNTVLAEDAFELSRLQQNNKLLAQRKQGLQEEIAREEAPGNLDRKARALGMRKSEQLAYWNGPMGRPINGPVRPVPNAAAASAGAAGVLGIPGAVIPGDGIPTAPGGRTAAPGAGTGAGKP
ncbi:hypothetical protein [Actinomadura macrotermitis]|uniref:Septum formation initiator n=1 Tax=Actinomadura macrotermitis TaxID=2585200 RepID=A0A7K0BML9_9ACTN|nr:hypothetical protein [Actinomadura macrotermitis]MQY02326.1 hypothetical protein [Actinomadura macrotermitis]